MSRLSSFPVLIAVLILLCSLVLGCSSPPGTPASSSALTSMTQTTSTTVPTAPLETRTATAPPTSSNPPQTSTASSPSPTTTPTLADLMVTDLAISPSNPSPDQTVTITVTVKNQGAVASAACNVAFYIDRFELGTANLTSLPPGSAGTCNRTWTATVGSHAIRASVDSAGAVPESDETNNEKTLNMTTALPDLVVVVLSCNPANPSIEQTATLSATIANQGSGTSASCSVAFYLDGDSLGTASLAALQPGASRTVTRNWTATAGNHNIKVVADSAGNLPESDKNNNDKLIFLTTALPDLVILDISWIPANPMKGNAITFTATVRNQGTGSAEGCYTEFQVEGAYSHQNVLPRLAAGASATITEHWTATAGNHTVRLLVDKRNTVQELDETNNEKSATLLQIN